MPVIVLLPPGYGTDTQLRYPVFYLLHGNPGAPQQFFTQGGIKHIDATLAAQQRIQPMILVMPTGSPSFTLDEEWANSVQPHNDWENFVAFDLVKAIDTQFRTIPTERGRAIGGLSTGAYGALNIDFHHVGEFGLVAGWSPYYRAENSPYLFGHQPVLLAYNSPVVELPLVASQLRATHTFLWLYNGSYETYRGSEYFVDALARLHVDYRWSLEPGTHDWYLWRSVLPTALTLASDYFQRGAPPLSSVAPPTPVTIPVSTTPKIEIRTSTIIVKAGEPSIPVALSCSRAACSGSVEMVEGVAPHSAATAVAVSRSGSASVTGAVGVVLASAPFELQNRQIANVNLVITSEGRAILRSASSGSPVYESVVATVNGGVGATKTVAVG